LRSSSAQFPHTSGRRGSVVVVGTGKAGRLVVVDVAGARVVVVRVGRGAVVVVGGRGAVVVEVGGGAVVVGVVVTVTLVVVATVPVVVVGGRGAVVVAVVLVVVSVVVGTSVVVVTVVVETGSPRGGSGSASAADAAASARPTTARSGERRDMRRRTGGGAAGARSQQRVAAVNSYFRVRGRRSGVGWRDAIDPGGRGSPRGGERTTDTTPASHRKTWWCTLSPPRGLPRPPARCRTSRQPTPDRRPRYLTASGLIGDPTAPVTGSGGAVKRNSHTPSAAQSAASASRTNISPSVRPMSRMQSAWTGSGS